MAYHDDRREAFLARPSDADPAAILGDAAAYDVRLQLADVVPGQTYWRVIGVHHLTPSENQGKHGVYVDAVDESGKRITDPNLRLRWGWEGQRDDEQVEPKKFDKGANEPATNVDLYSGQNLWVDVIGDDLPSDRVLNMHTKHADEPGPTGENWNSIGHHSFFVTIQRTAKGEIGTVQPPVEKPEPIAGTVRVRQKLGIDANRPINPATGMIEPQVVEPAVISASGVGWVRLNFVSGPWRGPDDKTRYAGHNWLEAYRLVIDGLRSKGLRIYGLISDEALSSHRLEGQLRSKPASGDGENEWMDAYVKAFVQIVHAFKDDVTVFESFNEPDDWKQGSKPGWTNATPNWMHPGWFAILLERLYDAVRTEPDLADIPLISGPLQGLDINNNAGVRYLTSVYEHGERFFDWSTSRFPFDGIGYHLYVAQDEKRGQLAAIQSDYKRYMDELRATIKQAEGRDRPIYLSEIGWESRRVRDAQQLVRCMETGLQQLLDDESVALGFWFCTQDFAKEYGVYRAGPPISSNRKSIFDTLKSICLQRDEVPVSALHDDLVSIKPPIIEPPEIKPPVIEPPVEPPVVEPPIEPPIVDPIPQPPIVPPAQGNKLGFYLHDSTNQHNLYSAIDRVQPPVILIHADTANRTLLREIRQWRAPDAFVVGRLYKDNHTQRLMLDNDDPESHGRAMADEIINYDFGLASEIGANGRPLIDAWMSLNEAVPGPASDQFAQEPEETSRLLANYDRFQVAFRRRLQEAGIEAIAFNFGAGNFGEAAHYLDHFANTLAEYVYLGFHEYGWPTMYPGNGSASSAGSYRRCLEGIRTQHGDRHRAIITEAGLTRMFKEPTWGDKGWLNHDQTLTEDEYWSSLDWYNSHMMADDYVLGACLYEVGHHGDWVTFRHLGQDNQGQDIRLIDRIVALKDSAPTPAAIPAAAPAPPPPVPEAKLVAIAGSVTLHGFDVVDASVRLIGGAETLGTVSGAVLDAPSYVTWSRRVSGATGTPYQVWSREIAGQVAGITWNEFKRQVTAYNSPLAESDGNFVADQVYWLPENRGVAVEILWDRHLTGYKGNLWQCWQRFVRGKVVGLTYPLFKRQMVGNNPDLAIGQGLTANQHYTLPRNADHKRFALQQWTHSRGGFAFKGLPAGSYEIEVNAPGSLPYKTAFTCDGDLTLNLQLAPMVLPEPEPAPAPPPPPPGVAAAPAPAMAPAPSAGHSFVTSHNGEFVEDGHVFRFIGVNIRGLVHYGDPSTLQHAQKSHQTEQLQAAYDMGARVVRVFLSSMHVSAEATIERLREVLNLVRQRFHGLYILPAFANLYADVPFRIPGDEHFYAKIDPNFPADLLSASFFQGGYPENYMPYIRKVVSAFADDPTIFAWEVGNELKLDPHGPISMDNPRLAAFINFMHQSAREIRSLAPKQMVTTGMISTRHASLRNSPLERTLYDTSLFDFVTVHCYNEEYENDDSALAQTLGLPYIIEEAGFGNSYGSDRSDWLSRDMARWFDGPKPARGYMQWGFMATPFDMGDGDGDSGMDRSLHRDWDALWRVYKARADALNAHRPPISVPPEQPVKPPKPTGFQDGDTVYTHTVVNVRQSPGYVNKPADDVVGMLALGSSAEIIGDAVAADGLIWWPIHAVLDTGEHDAWAAESIPGQILLSKAKPPGVS